MLKKKKTTASGKLVLVKSVRRTRSHRMKFCVQRGLGALPSTSKRRGKSRQDFSLCGPSVLTPALLAAFLGIQKQPARETSKFHSLAYSFSSFLEISFSSSANPRVWLNKVSRSSGGQFK